MPSTPGIFSSHSAKLAQRRFANDTQPWLSAGHPLGHLWMDEFFEALDRDIITPIGIQEAVDRRFIRPSLLYQVTNRGATKENFPEDVRKADADFAVYCRERKYWISGAT